MRRTERTTLLRLDDIPEVPVEVSAIGVGYGLDRLAMLRYDIEDIRKVESSSVAETVKPAIVVGSET